jgi:hypothetical protein
VTTLKHIDADGNVFEWRVKVDIDELMHSDPGESTEVTVLEVLQGQVP